ncbi:MAG TPA: hypothetical protein VGP72_27665 [Planctomycetota bacterium]|jgi:hypothetical protein
MIPRSVGVLSCASCKRKLCDEEFARIGATAPSPSWLYFEYVCFGCGHRGRFLLPQQQPLSVAQALRVTADLLDLGDAERTKGVKP